MINVECVEVLKIFKNFIPIEIYKYSIFFNFESIYINKSHAFLVSILNFLPLHY